MFSPTSLKFSFFPSYNCRFNYQIFLYFSPTTPSLNSNSFFKDSFKFLSCTISYSFRVQSWFLFFSSLLSSFNREFSSLSDWDSTLIYFFISYWSWECFFSCWRIISWVSSTFSCRSFIYLSYWDNLFFSLNWIAYLMCYPHLQKRSYSWTWVYWFSPTNLLLVAMSI